MTEIKKIFVCSTEQSGDNICSNVLKKIKTNNNLIIDGFGYYQDAQNELETRPEFWQEVIDNTGVLNLMSMFQEIMLQDGNVRRSLAISLSHRLSEATLDLKALTILVNRLFF